MEMGPFVATLINDLLVARRTFAGLVVFGGDKRYANILNNSNITTKEKNLTKSTAVRFMADVSTFHARFLSS